MSRNDKLDKTYIRKAFRPDENELTKLGPPVDFSFRRISALSDLGSQQPRTLRVGRVPGRGANNRYLTRSIWLNNNNLSSIVGIESLVNNKLEQPSALTWLDCSFNSIIEIDEEITRFPNLMILYFHGNSIISLSSLARLRKLSKLRNLTLHGNPIETIPSYRAHIINLLPQVGTLDFAPVIPSERTAAPPTGSAKWLTQH